MPKAGGEVVFGSRDNRAQYGGKGMSGASKDSTKGKAPKQLSAKFDKPMVPMPGLVGSSSDSDAKRSSKGEKSKKKIVSSPSASSGAGAVGGRDGGNSSTDDSMSAGADFPKNKLGELCHDLGKIRGECISCVVLLC